MNPLGPRPAPPPVGNVSHWPSSLFYKFSRHMSQRSKAHSTNQDHIMHPLDRADAIIAAASSFVQAHPRPQLVQDAVEQRLADELHHYPTSKRAQQAWAHHRATNNMKRAGIFVIEGRTVHAFLFSSVCLSSASRSLLPSWHAIYHTQYIFLLLSVAFRRALHQGGRVGQWFG